MYIHVHVFPCLRRPLMFISVNRNTLVFLKFYIYKYSILIYIKLQNVREDA